MSVIGGSTVTGHCMIVMCLCEIQLESVGTTKSVHNILLHMTVVLYHIVCTYIHVHVYICIYIYEHAHVLHHICALYNRSTESVVLTTL